MESLKKGWLTASHKPSRKVNVHTGAALTEHQDIFLEYVERKYPFLRNKLVGKAYNTLTDDEIALLKINIHINPLVILGVCSKYKLRKTVGGIISAVGEDRWSKISVYKW